MWGGGNHEYVGGCSDHWSDIMIHVGRYHEYIGGCSVHWKDIMIYMGDIMGTSGGGSSVCRSNTMSTSGFSI